VPVTWHCDAALLSAGSPAARDVRLDVDDDGRLTAMTAGTPAPPGAHRLRGLVLPGLANAHSHAFHRVLRGRGERSRADFWGWREAMYRVAAVLDPEAYHRLARAVYAEMALAGVTAVGEFHYLHHDPGGRPYAEPNAMGEALVAAAGEAGVRLTLLDACYLRGGPDRPLEGVQRRFGDGDAHGWADRVAELAERDRVRVGAAAHSVRAVDEPALATVAAWARERGAPLHVHVSEQPAENDAVRAATGRSPTGVLADAGVLGPKATAVHATHVTEGDVAALGSAGAGVCACPTTEAALADGVGPLAALERAGCPLSVGSDSHAAVDLLAEARGVEHHQRLMSGRRGHHAPERLLTAATEGGAEALGWDAGRLEVGRPADLCALDLGSPRLAGVDLDDAAAHAVFAATAAEVTDVVVGGRQVVAGGAHLAVGDVGAALQHAIDEVAAAIR
jgi:formiminoglutamate deiminase